MRSGRWLFLTFTLPATVLGFTECDEARSLSLRETARSAFNGRRYEEAARRLEQALEACPERSALLLEISQAHAYRRDLDAAVRAAQQFLEQQPDSVPGRLAVANAYFLAQRLPEARQSAENALKIEPANPTALKIKANAEYLLGRFERAEEVFLALLDAHPDDEEAAYMLGRVYYQEGRLDHAIGLFQRVLRINPFSYKAHDNLGLCYQARNEPESAVRHFLAAIQLVEKSQPDYDWPYANLAELLLETGDPQKAFAAASKAADRNPGSARNFYLGGKALCQLDKTDLCLNWLQRSAALDPNYSEPLYLLARVYRQLGQQDKAQEALERFRLARESRGRNPRR